MSDRQEFERSLTRNWFGRDRCPERMFEGVVSVPGFATSEEAMNFVAGLDPEDTPDIDVIDPETGEVFLEEGEPARQSYYHPAGEEEERRRHEEMTARDYISIEGWDEEERVIDFESKYAVEKKDLSDLWDQPEGMTWDEAGYDTYRSVAVSIQRQDDDEFNEDDVDNIEEYLDNMKAEQEEIYLGKLYYIPQGLKIGSQKVTVDYSPM